jgi:hypothetical protein
MTAKQIIDATSTYLRKSGLTHKDLLNFLNKRLPSDKQIPDNRSGLVQISRWLSHKSEPKADIILAMKDFIGK